MNAELQGVPLEHIAHLPKSHQFTLIGNAVPPVFAEGVMRTILGSVL
jgi:site-specific DNA-cytosine methylase